MFEVKATVLPGVLELLPQVRADQRGRFVKTFHRGFFAGNGLAADYAEQYYSVSSRGVLRGLHFQLPPDDHEKLVYCVAGRVLDAALDLRAGSPTFGRHVLVELSAEKANQVYLPKGLAHGFYTLSTQATLVYNVATVHSPERDAGILWSSAGIPWPDPEPMVSARDAEFPPLDGFQSPFTYQE